jgi:hypothetical protein
MREFQEFDVHVTLFEERTPGLEVGLPAALGTKPRVSG